MKDDKLIQLTTEELDQSYLNSIQNLAMVAGALQTINVFLDRIDPEVDPEDKIDMSSSDQNEN